MSARSVRRGWPHPGAVGQGTRAVSALVLHYRQLRELTRDELAYVLSMSGHPLSPDAIAEMENRDRPVTVDDLMAIAHALDTTPAVLLTHIPIDMPAPEGPLATGLPADLDQAELRAWVEGRTELDRESRVQWWEDRTSRLRVLSTHHEEQLQGAYAELRELGELAEREADAPPVQVLHERIRDGEYAMNQADLALALAEQQLDGLREDAR
jgi:transcriptional regulator with XRE-family HTH domain